MKKEFVFLLIISVFFVLCTAVLAQEEEEELLPEEAVGVPINIIVAPRKLVCLFFISAPSVILKNEIIIFQTLNVNCGNQPINVTTWMQVINDRGEVVKERSTEIFLNRSLERKPFYLYFSTSVTGTYILTAGSKWNNETLVINTTFDVVEAAWNLTQRIQLPIPIKEIISAEISLPRETNVSRNTTLLLPINITNTGTVDLINIVIFPIVPTGWNVTPAHITTLPVDATVLRTVGLFPGKEVPIAPYLIIIETIYKNETLKRDFTIVNVQTEIGAAIIIEEFPPVFEIYAGVPKNFSLILRNIGNTSLSRIEIDLENEEECIEPYQFPKIPSLDVGKTTLVQTELVGRDVKRTCNVSIVVTTWEGAAAMAMTTMKVYKKITLPQLIISFLVTNIWILIIIIILTFLITARLVGKWIKRRMRIE
ncbi:MAG: hypothetical protein QMD14_01185 [Candidatus Aenigmarchaeota archaeon]|nr:hypothetical protein [Candidatus Aenigmarchaeota archaeon]